MLTTIRAKFANGVIVPLEPIDIPEGASISVTIDVKPNLSTGERMKIDESAAGGPLTNRTLAALKATAGAWEGTHDPEKLIREIYSDRLIGSKPEPKI